MTDRHIKKIQAVAIGASTGGPSALEYLISKLPKDLDVPIFIVQHMPKDFTTSFAMRLDKASQVKVVEVEDKMKIEKGVVFIAPGDFHMTVERDTIRLDSRAKLFGVRPCVDYLFKSAAEVYGENLLGIILTGMGKDGSDGMHTIKINGGYNIAQDEESSVIYGMPGNAVESGVVDSILSLEDISKVLNNLTKVK